MKRVIIALLFSSLALAQRHPLPAVVDSGTPEGQLLQQIGQESAEAKKLELLEQFVAKYPAHEGAGWALVQLQAGYMKANQYDKALEAGEKLLKIDPLDAEVAHQNLKASEAKKDPALVLKWSGETAQIAQKMLGSTQPKEEDQVEEWKRQVEFSKQVIAYTEWSLSAMATQPIEPRDQVALMEALEQRNPSSQYLKQIRPMEFAAYMKLNDQAKALGVAEKIVTDDPNNADMLVVLASAYLDKKAEPEKIIAYTNKVIEVTGKAGGDADHNRMLAGRAYWIQGKEQFTKNKLKEADKSLREALPLINDPGLKADTLFHLGLVNYRLKNIVDSVKFNQECATIKSPYQAAAQRNLKAIRAEYREVR